MSQEDQAQVFAICADEAEQEMLFRELSRKSFILPDSLVRSLGFAHTIGAMLVLILASLAIGVEYSWGTLRGVLTKGIRRWQFLGAKALLLVLMVTAGLFFLSLTVVASSLIAALLTLHEGGGLADSGEWRTAAVMFGKMVYALTPYVILALFLSVLTASLGIGVALSLAYYLAEDLLDGHPVGVIRQRLRLPARSQRHRLDGRTRSPNLGGRQLVGSAVRSAEQPVRLPRHPGIHRRAQRRSVVAFSAQRCRRSERRMIVHILRLTRWEWFKLRKRWMPWILVATAVAIAQVTLWGMFYSYNDRPSVEEQTTFYLPGPVDAAGDSAAIPVSCLDIWEGTADTKVEQSGEAYREDAIRTVEHLREEACPSQIEEEARFRDSTRQSFVLPNSLSNGLAVAHSIGAVLIMILAASVLGTEYGWGTLRATLARGVNRWQFLGSKALSLLLLGAGGFIIVTLTVAVSSLIAASLLVDDGRAYRLRRVVYCGGDVW